MFSCNNRNSIFCDSVFWIVVITAIIILWVHYSCEGGLGHIGGDGCTDYCC